MKPKSKYLIMIGIAALSVGAGTEAAAQSADALIDKLVQKGILTVKEGNELREEADKNFKESFTVKTGMPDWVNQLKFSGDVRLRYEGFFSDAGVEHSPGGELENFTERNRFRYRLRFGVTATMFDNLEAGLRLTSSEPGKDASSNFGGDPISGNSTFENDGSKKFIYIDQVYAKWHALNGPVVSGSITGGKMENPLVLSDMVFDPDYTPEGAALQTGFKLSDKQTIKFNGGAFILDEIGSSSEDPYMLAGQVRWDAAWHKKFSSSAGLSGLMIANPTRLTASAVPNQNAGNTRLSNGVLAYDYNPFIADASVTYTLDKFPLYRGAFPIRLGGEYMNNPAAPSGADDYGYNAGIMFGKSGKKGTWDLSYTYKWLGGDAWYEELVDSDFGALYPRAYASRGAAAGYNAGTNVRGHIFRFAYSPTDSLVLSAKWFLTDVIHPTPSSADSEMNRIQVDAMLKF
jgi:hypothetical protein